MCLLLCDRCLTGNVAEFKLSPRWGYSPSVYGCHIEPVPGYNIYDVEFYATLVVSIPYRRGGAYCAY